MEGFPDFIDIDPARIVARCADGINSDWMLITAGNRTTGAATMTISWGAFGFLWGKNLAVAAIRKSRHTLPYIMDNKAFSLAFFDPSFRDKLTYCGRHSGYECDKISHCGFTTLFEGQIPFFAESQTVLFCRTMYAGDIERAGFIEQTLFDEWYGHGVHKDDMHTVLFASIERVLTKKSALN